MRAVLEERLALLRAAINRPIPSALLVGWALLSVYDTFISQFIPPEWHQWFPKAWEVLALVWPDISLLGWTVVLLALLLGITIEYANRIQKDKKTGVAEALGSPGSERIPFIDLLREAEKRGLNFLGDNPTILNLCKELRQAASDGTLKCWGRDHRMNDPLVAIPAGHWRNFGIDWSAAVVLGPPSGDIKGFADNNFFVGTRAIDHKKAYFDLHVDSGKALQIVDLMPWRNQTAYFVWVAACLWIDMKPVGVIDLKSRAYPVLNKIKSALATGLIKSIDGGTDMKARVSSDELRKLALHYKESPRFLFEN